MGSITREFRSEAAVAITNSLGTTAEIFIGDLAAMVVEVPNGSGLTGLTIFGQTIEGGTFQPISGVSALVVAANNIYPIPDDAMKCRKLKLVGNTSGAVNLFGKG